LHHSKVLPQKRIGHSYRPILLWSLSSVGPLSNFHHPAPSLFQTLTLCGVGGIEVRDA
jgi:hypothetical protein